ncbi:LysM peptidoglycan-binding domain-containing protein [Cytobacillus kochii]|uniref:LysM peptidoglycan-binding domain-containing protein n=1 Tax=Cytobacillus kochii TaxID=859143 RepID=UPI00402A703B
MIKNKKIELTIRDEKTGKYYAIPVLPEKIEYAEGEKQASTVNIIDLGDVDFLNGVALDSMGWASFFPARYDAGYVGIRNPLQPTAYIKLFNGWKDNGTPLRIICPAAAINQHVYMASFSWDLRGFEGDVYYSVDFKERRTIKPIQLKVNRPAPPANKKTPSKRPGKSKPAQPKYYVVKSGDWLIKIAKRHGIKDWRGQLYNPNKKVIGSNPNLIYPGQKLKLP